MKIGIETESFHLFFQYQKIDAAGFINKAYELGFEGVELNIIPGWGLHPELGQVGADSVENLDMLRQLIEKNNMYVELDTNGTDYEGLSKALRVAERLGADRIRTYIRFSSFDRNLYAQTVNDLKRIVPLLKQYRIKLALENHEYEVSGEVIDIIKKVDSQWVGLHFDFGNSMMAWEDPLIAAENMAPYTIMTHFKDQIIIEEPEAKDGYVVAGVPLGEGSINLDAAYKIMLDKSPLTRINMEMCYPYCTEFKREPGAGGIYKVGEGAFEVKPAPYSRSFIKPLNYYFPHKVAGDDVIQKLMDDQFEGVKRSVRYLKSLRDKYSAVK